MWAENCPLRARFARVLTLAIVLILPLHTTSLKLDHMDTQANFVRCKVQHCSPTWDPVIATMNSQEHAFANACELGCYFQVTGVEENSVELNSATHDNSLHPNAACLRAWKHVLFEEWSTLDPALTEKDPLPPWFTSLYNSPEMDASEASTVLAWCLDKEAPPLEKHTQSRHILAEMHSLVPPPGQVTNTDVETSDSIQSSDLVDGGNESDGDVVSKMEQFPAATPGLVVNINSSDISTDPTRVYNESLVTTVASTPDGSSNLVTGNDQTQQQGQQQQQGMNEGTLIPNPPTLNTSNKPTLTPSTPEQEQPAQPPSTDNGTDSSPLPEDSPSNSPPNTPSKPPKPSPKPDNNNNNDGSSPPNTSQGDVSGNGDGNGNTTTEDSNSPTNDSSSSPDSPTDNSQSTNNGSDNSNNSGDQGDDGSSGNSNNGNSSSENTDGKPGKEVSLDDLAIPGDYKPVIIKPAFTVDDLSSRNQNSAAAAAVDPETLLQAGGADGSASGIPAPVDVSGSDSSGETPALPQIAMSQTSSAVGLPFASSWCSMVVGVALSLALIVVLGL